jgi:hypothetical protein
VYIFIEIMGSLDRRLEWSIAANSILELCRDKGLDLNVEIADPCGLMPKISATISPTLSIVLCWESLLPGIMFIKESSRSEEVAMRLVASSIPWHLHTCRPGGIGRMDWSTLKVGLGL